MMSSTKEDIIVEHGTQRKEEEKGETSDPIRKKKNHNKYRQPLNPIPILDRKLLVKSLPGNIQCVLKDQHLDVFYQALHRAKYPEDLGKFVSDLLSSYSSSSKVTKKLPSSFLLHILRHCSPEAQQNNDTYFYATTTSKVINAFNSLDNSTTKLVIQLQDSHVVEAVIMRHGCNRERKQPHITLCVSSQVGCAMKCVFCATGTMGIRGNLVSGEILEQLVHASSFLIEEKVRNVVFMGMGEPLNNYDNVVAACRAMVDTRTWSMQHHHVTVSTVGIISKIYKLTRDLPFVSLALSLHAPNQSMREKIIPTAKYYPLEELINALDQHSNICINGRGIHAKPKRSMIEYVMLNGDTSSLECAHELGKLCENRSVVVNLIPYNPTVLSMAEGDHNPILSSPPYERIVEFQRIVQSYGCLCFVRKTMGQDILGACGQLAVLQQPLSENERRDDIEDILLLDASRTADHSSMKAREVKSKRRLVAGPSAVSSDASKEGKKKLGTAVASIKDVTNIMGEMKAENNIAACRRDDNDLSDWILPLIIATSISAACFAVSGTLLLTRRK